MPSKTLGGRFWEKVSRKSDTSCWEWLACKSNGGYGRFVGDKGHIFAHRFAYELALGPIPDGKELDHLCRNRACVNPAHLEPVTHKENLMRGATLAARESAKTHCPQGHPYTGENLYVNATSGARVCRTCANASSRRSKVRRREQEA